MSNPARRRCEIDEGVGVCVRRRWWVGVPQTPPPPPPPARDWTRVRPISTSFSPLRLIFSASFFHYRVWTLCAHMTKKNSKRIFLILFRNCPFQCVLQRDVESPPQLVLSLSFRENKNKYICSGADGWNPRRPTSSLAVGLARDMNTGQTHGSRSGDLTR